MPGVLTPEFGIQDVNWSDPINHEHPLAQGLVGFWLPGGPGFRSGTLYDISGNANHGTLNGGATWSADSYPGGPGSISYDETSFESVLLPSVEVPQEAGYLSAWARFATATGTSKNPIFSHRTTSGATRLFDIYLYNGTLEAGWFDDGDEDRIKYTWLPTVGVWYHFGLCWRSGGDTKLWINGDLVATTSNLTATWDTTAGTCRIGIDPRGGTGNRAFDGEIGPVVLGGIDTTTYEEFSKNFPGLLNRNSSKRYYFAPAGGGGANIPAIMHHRRMMMSCNT